MYTYFALQTLGIRPPKPLAMSITILQILQMVGGIYILSRARSLHSAGSFCQVPDSVINFGFLIYSSYFALFVHFFLEAYVFGRKNILNSKKGELSSSSSSSSSSDSIHKAVIPDLNNNAARTLIAQAAN